LARFDRSYSIAKNPVFTFYIVPPLPPVSYCDFIDLVYSFWSAMGKSWTTPAEKTFLDAEFKNYLSNQGEKKYGTRKRFLHGLYL
jgi:hypothetical protein